LGRTTDQSELPRPELNPLLNPRLAENMGRWAEVYFTAPPEKREEAVLDLLRELESQGTEATGAAVTQPSELHPPDFRGPQHSLELESLHVPMATESAATMRCPTCGHDNPQSHQFCGMCGIYLEQNRAAASQGNHANEKRTFGGNSFDAAHHNTGEPESSALNAARVPSYREPAAESDELTLFRSISAGSVGNYDERIDWTDESNASQSYRGFIGIALAVILLGLGYLFWRTQTSQNAHKAPSMPPVGISETSASAFPTNVPEAESPSSAASAPPAEAALPKANGPAVHPVEPKAATETPVHRVPVINPTTSSAIAGTGNGAEELATAQRYLNGGNGTARDSAEAAKWLWKSVALHNSAASLALADLYLKGNGVSKNCDQARVLLDAAALKGVQGAGERLRHLQAFGCQ
jgi:hypothetical protein